MQDQPRFKPLAKSDFYSDLRSARPPVEGTVARGQLHEDSYFYTGKVRKQSRRLYALPGDRPMCWLAAASASIFTALPATRASATAMG